MYRFCNSEVPRTLFEARKVAGSAKYKQSQTVWNSVVFYGQFVYFVHSVMKKKTVCLFNLFRHSKNQSMKIFHF